MDSYGIFANIYDTLMEDTPYSKWSDNIEYFFNKYSISPKLILDLGCGTGTLTNIFHNKGYEMIGIDLSEDMLRIAKNKNDDILFLNQDMREFELFGTVDIIYSVCDSLNYILEKDDLVKTFKLVNNYLNPKGLFIFDMNTIYKFKNILAYNTYGGMYNDGTVGYIWENFFNDENNINEYYTTFFIEDNNGQYSKYEEFHQERAYAIDEIKEIIKLSGLEFIEVKDESLEDISEKSERVYFICREKGK